jgi:hypothetical protein
MHCVYLIRSTPHPSQTYIGLASNPVLAGLLPISACGRSTAFRDKQKSMVMQIQLAICALF